MALKWLKQESYQQHGRLVPPMPTDDGVTLCAAVLMDDRIKDLVRPLREAGWSVDVGENDASHLCEGSSHSRQRKAQGGFALRLRSGNQLYRELVQSNDVILHRGSPYRQDQHPVASPHM